MIDPFYDSLLQFGNVVEDTSAYLLASDFGEEALNQIEPGRRCRDEVQLEARMALEPTLYSRRLVRGVVVGDQVEIEIGEGFSVDLLEKLEEFPGAMARHAFTDDLACRHIERREQSCRAARPFLSGKPGCVRSRAWIWLFSSTESTKAFSGGLR